MFSFPCGASARATPQESQAAPFARARPGRGGLPEDLPDISAALDGVNDTSIPAVLVSLIGELVGKETPKMSRAQVLGRIGELERQAAFISEALRGNIGYCVDQGYANPRHCAAILEAMDSVIRYRTARLAELKHAVERSPDHTADWGDACLSFTRDATFGVVMHQVSRELTAYPQIGRVADDVEGFMKVLAHPFEPAFAGLSARQILDQLEEGALKPSFTPEANAQDIRRLASGGLEWDEKAVVTRHLDRTVIHADRKSYNVERLLDAVGPLLPDRTRDELLVLLTRPAMLAAIGKEFFGGDHVMLMMLPEMPDPAVSAWVTQNLDEFESVHGGAARPVVEIREPASDEPRPRHCIIG